MNDFKTLGVLWRSIFHGKEPAALVLPDATIVYGNEALNSLLGRSADEILGHSFMEFLKTDERVRLTVLLNEISSAKSGTVIELLTKDGLSVPVSVAMIFLNSKEKRIMGILLNMPAEKADGFPGSLPAPTSSLAKPAPDAMEELIRSNRDLEDFAYMISHDLQSPLKKIISFSDLLKMQLSGKMEPKIQDYLDRIQKCASRMNTMIRSLLEFSKVTSSNRELKDVDMNKVLNDVLSDLEDQIRESGAVIQKEPLPSVRAHDTQMVQLFTNLMNNALQYAGGKRPAVHISAKKEGHEWIFSVRDKGVGIESKYLNRLFDVFQRTDHNERPGKGIGLAICKKILHNHRGKIWVTSKVNEGSTFYFSIPAE